MPEGQRVKGLSNNTFAFALVLGKKRNKLTNISNKIIEQIWKRSKKEKLKVKPVSTTLPWQKTTISKTEI